MVRRIRALRSSGIGAVGINLWGACSAIRRSLLALAKQVLLVVAMVVLKLGRGVGSYITTPNHSLNPDASPAALARRPLGAG